MKEECKWGKPTYTVDGKNIVIMQGFKEYFGLGFFQGALLEDPKKVLVQLGQVRAGRVMKCTSVEDIRARAETIKAYVRDAIAVEKAGLRMERKKTSDLPVLEELTERFRRDPRFKRAFEALSDGLPEATNALSEEPEKWQRWFEVLLATSTDPTVVDMSSHMLYVGRTAEAG